MPPERQAKRRTATRQLMEKTLSARRGGDPPLGLHALPDQRLRRRRRDEPGRVRGLLLPRLPGRMTPTRSAPGSAPPRSARASPSGPQGHEEVRVTAPGHRHQAGDRRAQVHRRRRHAQHAGRRVLHGADRGLGRGRGDLSPAGDGRRARGGGRAPSLRVGKGRRRRRRARRGVPDQPAGHRRGCAPARRAGHRHQLRNRPRDPRRPARREDRRHRPHGRRRELSGVRRARTRAPSTRTSSATSGVAAGSRSTARRSRRTGASWSEIEHAPRTAPLRNFSVPALFRPTRHH